MRIGLTEKASKKIHLSGLPKLEESDFSLQDWSISLFVVNRIHFYMATNAKTYLSTVFPAKGINDSTGLIKHLSWSLEALFKEYNQELIFQNFVEPRSQEIFYYKSLSKSLVSNMNQKSQDMKYMPSFLELSPLEISIMLNEAPMGCINYNSALQELQETLKHGI